VRREQPGTRVDQRRPPLGLGQPLTWRHRATLVDDRLPAFYVC
jgi:hypothetical protein